MNHPKSNQFDAYPIVTVNRERYLNERELRVRDTEIAIGQVCLLREIGVRPTITHHADTRMVRIMEVDNPIELPQRPLATVKAFLPVALMPMDRDPRTYPENETYLLRRDTSMVHAHPAVTWQRPPEVGYLLKLEHPEEFFRGPLTA